MSVHFGSSEIFAEANNWILKFFIHSDGEVDLSFYVNDKRIGCGVRWMNDRSKVFALNGSTLGTPISLQQAESVLRRHRIEIALSD